MFDLLANFQHFRHEMLAPKPLPFPPPPSCTLPGADIETDKNGLEFLCYQKQLFTGVTREVPSKGSLAVTVWSQGSPIETYVQGKGNHAAVYERCPITTTPEHRAYELVAPCNYVEPSEVPRDTVNFSMSW